MKNSFDETLKDIEDQNQRKLHKVLDLETRFVQVQMPFNPFELISLLDSFCELDQDENNRNRNQFIDMCYKINKKLNQYQQNSQLFHILQDHNNYSDILYKYFQLFNDEDLLIGICTAYSYISTNDDLNLLQVYFHPDIVDLLLQRILDTDNIFTESAKNTEMQNIFLTSSKKVQIQSRLLLTLYNLCYSKLFPIETIFEINNEILHFSMQCSSSIQQFVYHVLVGTSVYVALFDEENGSLHMDFYKNMQISIYNILELDDIRFHLEIYQVYIILIQAMKSKKIDANMSSFIEKMIALIENLPDPSSDYYSLIRYDFIQYYMELLTEFYKLEDGMGFINNSLDWDLLWQKMYGYDQECNKMFFNKITDLVLIDTSQIQYFNIFEKLLSVYDDMDTDSKCKILSIFAVSFFELNPYQIDMLLSTEFLSSAEMLATNDPISSFNYLTIFDQLFERVMASDELKFKYGEQFYDLSTIEEIENIAAIDKNYEKSAVLCETILEKAKIDDD
ncbi:hypothetical protein TVAG_185820 [Trichomonas vaginalis G3]|uniref:Uncharacterized protein n=1 Tax=Trichomonas vaginalis (strain ATCC PRA-98 / G3) TaxID=412133 RepID=A2D8M6_TRIV3|nr:hypothetical protein TVAGG3_0392400 [Trichomonas vaginalis G3]EAY23275.1 hypothetical protein TVAG_185820 [Trichomonas vaginalis G3]KAI5534076.1 hypothetical protein TVAGG3_0392400 [Trichomonas vaginalis G3]|eukprot:XP_001584261.1 hypothetical protein [Trichomonas vaginalis G3]